LPSPQACQVTPHDTEIALAAAEACHAHRLTIADAIIFATSQARGTTLLTCDAHFDRLPGVNSLSKTSA
jgi:predicted nucleic acid-binding protein